MGIDMGVIIRRISPRKMIKIALLVFGAICLAQAYSWEAKRDDFIEFGLTKYKKKLILKTYLEPNGLSLADATIQEPLKYYGGPEKKLVATVEVNGAVCDIIFNTSSKIAYGRGGKVTVAGIEGEGCPQKSKNVSGIRTTNDI